MRIPATRNGKEGPPGRPGDRRGPQRDDFGCFSDTQNLNPLYVAPAGQSAANCLNSNDPGSGLHSTAFLFSSPSYRNNYTTSYSQAAFEADLPRVEAADFGGSCNRTTGDCTNPPMTEDGHPAMFYPYFSTVNNGRACNWGAGDTLPNTIANFGRSSAEFGPLHPSVYWVTGDRGQRRPGSTTTTAGLSRIRAEWVHLCFRRARQPREARLALPGQLGVRWA
jgi:hypothetical protein